MAPVAELLADRYELGVRLGSGGMGDVYRARDRLLERVVAVKVPTATVTPASAERFKREARAAARLNHPNIVGVYDWGGGTEPFIVMEFVEGRSLRAELRARHTLPPEDVAAIGTQIADALAHAHHHGVVHRDVKPSNVLLAPGGRVKVTDFGIALSAAGEGLTESGVVLGTVGYLSPEQVAGLPADARSDVYSLGVVLAELLTGERPTGGEEEPATELERVVTKARSTDPNARHQSATELRDALRDAATTPGVVVPAGVPEAVPLTESPVTAAPVEVATEDPSATARATGHAATSALPVAAVAAGAVVAPPPRPSPQAPKPRRWRRPKTTYPKLENASKPVKPMKPPKPKRQRRKARTAATTPLAPPAKRSRTWKLRHWLVIIAAPVLLVGAGIVAYVRLTEGPPQVAVPDLTDRDVFAAASLAKNAGLALDARAVDSPRPGGIILRQQPVAGRELDKGATVVVTISRTDAVVPDVSSMDVEAARALLTKKGLVTTTVTPDYRDDVDPGTVVRTVPAAYSRARKSDPLELVVAADPHVTVPNVIGRDQASATSALQEFGLQVAVQTASSSSAPVGQVMRSKPAYGDTAVRGDTVTLTVSSGPKQVIVPYVVGSKRDDAISKLEDHDFAVNVVTSVATGKQVGKVLGQDPSGGRAAKGSTVTITVGVEAAAS